MNAKPGDGRRPSAAEVFFTSVRKRCQELAAPADEPIARHHEAWHE